MQGPIQPRHTVGVSSSSVKQDRKNFVYFSNETKGAVGRAVKIDTALFPAFLAMVDPATYSGQQMVRAIVNLRSTARPPNSHANKFNSFEYLMTVGTLAVRYRVASEGADDKGTVYITRISSHGGSEKSGFYKVSVVSTMVNTESFDGQKFSHSSVYFNGPSESGGGADTIKDISRLALSRCQQKSCMMVYGAGDVVNELGVWGPSSAGGWQKRQLVSRVREALELNAGEKKQWIAEGEGVALLLEAVSHTTGNSRQDLNYEKNQFSNYQFKLLNPVGDVSKLMGLLRQKKALITEQTLSYDKPGRAATVSALAQYGQLVQRLSTLGSNMDFNHTMTKRFKQAVGSKVAQYKAGSAGSPTFYELIAKTNRALK